MGTGTPSRPSGQRVQEHVGTHVAQHSSPHGHGDTVPSIRSESTRTRGNTHDAKQQPSWARGHHPLHQVRVYRTRGNTHGATQQPSWARGHHPLHQVREYKNMWEHTWRNTAAHMGTGTPSPPSGQRVQEHTTGHAMGEHVGTHVTQHSSPHGRGDTIPSIRSESTITLGNTRDTTQQPSWARGHHPLHQVREYKNTWEHT